MEPTTILTLIAAALIGGLITLLLTPPVRSLAIRIGAVDLPRDSRRLHTRPIPRMGGLGIFVAFLLTSLLMAEHSSALLALWLGGLVIVFMGIIDDVFRIHPLIKLLIQIAAALVVVSHGFVIEFLRIGDYYVILEEGRIPFTVLWIVLVTNAMNLLDGLDGLGCGVAAISSASLTALMLMQGQTVPALLGAILCGCCLGFLPFNRAPARIFLGDTGSQLLGFFLSVLTLTGLFRMHTLISFFAPIAVLALPLFDTSFAFFRRLFTGKNPFKGDRGHLHHRLLDSGLDQRDTVRVLHAVCALFGISALLYSIGGGDRIGLSAAVGGVILLICFALLRPAKAGSVEEAQDWEEDEEQTEEEYDEEEYDEDEAYDEMLEAEPDEEQPPIPPVIHTGAPRRPLTVNGPSEDALHEDEISPLREEKEISAIEADEPENGENASSAAEEATLAPIEEELPAERAQAKIEPPAETPDLQDEEAIEEATEEATDEPTEERSLTEQLAALKALLDAREEEQVPADEGDPPLPDPVAFLRADAAERSAASSPMPPSLFHETAPLPPLPLPPEPPSELPPAPPPPTAPEPEEEEELPAEPESYLSGDPAAEPPRRRHPRPVRRPETAARQNPAKKERKA